MKLTNSFCGHCAEIALSLTVDRQDDMDSPSHIDLTGLPPLPGETAVFITESLADAHERDLDRLLRWRTYGQVLAECRQAWRHSRALSRQLSRDVAPS